MPAILPSKVVSLLPVRIRLLLAKLTLWQRRHRASLVPALLTVLAVVMSGALGYAAALQLHQPSLAMAHQRPPDLGAALALSSTQIQRDAFPGRSEWGRLQAELSRLRVLLKRIADLSDFNGGEFDLEAEISAQSDISLQNHAFSAQPNAANNLWEVVKQDVDHISRQARTMLFLAERSILDQQLSISGKPVENGIVTSHYGIRTDPRSGRQQFHRGIDFAGKPGTKVVALAKGVVTYSARNGGYGNLVELEHAGGYRSRYAHNSANLVPVGAHVEKGDPIALMGSTGKSTGTHVHVEVRKNGRAVDPASYLQ